MMPDADFPAELLAELQTLEAPTPQTHLAHLRDGSVALELRQELADYLVSSVRALGAALTDTPNPSVYADLGDVAGRTATLADLDATLRSTISSDLAVLAMFLTTGSADVAVSPALLRALNRLRMALAQIPDAKAANASFVLVSVLLADLLEISTFT